MSAPAYRALKNGRAVRRWVPSLRELLSLKKKADGSTGWRMSIVDSRAVLDELIARRRADQEADKAKATLAPPAGATTAKAGEAAVLYTQVCERDCDEDCAAPNGDLMMCPDAPCTLIRCGPASAEKPTEGDAPAAAPTPMGAQPGLAESLLASPCVCGHPLSQHVPRGGTLACTAKDCACGPGCIHEGFVLSIGESASPTGALGREAPSDLSSAGFMCRYCHRDFPHYRYHHDQDAIAAAGLSGPVCDGCDAVHGVGHPSALWMMVCDKSSTPHPLNAGAPCSNPRRADAPAAPDTCRRCGRDRADHWPEIGGSLRCPAPAAPQATGERET